MYNHNDHDSDENNKLNYNVDAGVYEDDHNVIDDEGYRDNCSKTIAKKTSFIRTKVQQNLNVKICNSTIRIQK